MRVQLLRKPEVALRLEEKDGFCDLICHHLRRAGPLRLRLHFTLQDGIYMHWQSWVRNFSNCLDGLFRSTIDLSHPAQEMPFPPLLPKWQFPVCSGLQLQPSLGPAHVPRPVCCATSIYKTLKRYQTKPQTSSIKYLSLISFVPQSLWGSITEVF